MDLQERLERYTVTAVPGRERLRLLWSVASELAVDDERPEAAAVGASATISLLDTYRITRVPARAAS